MKALTNLFSSDLTDALGWTLLHSLWQATINTLQIRSTVFLLSSLVMCALAVRALLSVI